MNRGHRWAAITLALFLVPVTGAQAATTPARADLTVTSVGNPPATGTPGASFASVAKVKNRGKANAGATTMRFFLSLDGKVGRGDMRLADRRVTRLKPGKTWSGRSTLKVPTFTPAGTYRVLACGDRLKKLRESNEGNNCRSAKRRVRIVRTSMLGPGTPGSGNSPALVISPGEQAFAAAVGLAHGPVKFTVTNSGKAASGTLGTEVAGTDAAMFKVSSDTCAGKTLATGASCTLNVTFSPTSTGAKTASVRVSGAPGGLAAATLNGTGQTAASLGVSPTTQQFPSTGVGSKSSAITFTVTNNGQAVSGAVGASVAGTDATQFKIAQNNCAGVTLTGGANCTVTVTFDPTGTGGKSASLQISGTPGGSTSAALTGTGLTPAVLSVSPPSETFGTVSSGGTSGEFTFTVSNSGQETSGTLATSITGADTAQFVVTNNGCTGVTLAENATCLIKIVFAPSGAAGDRSASLQVTAAPGGTTSATLAGTATPPDLTISPASHNYALIQVGSSAAQDFTVTNTDPINASSGLNMTITGNEPDRSQFTITPTGTTCVQGNPLAAGASCVIRVTFAPSGSTSPGTRSAALQVAGGSAGTVTAALSGTAVPGPAALAVSPSNQDFGSVAVGSSSASFTFTVTNNGGEASGPLSRTVGGTHAAQFAITGGTCGTAPLAAGATCTVLITFSPAGTPVPGARSATLTVSATPGGSSTAVLTGSATPGPAALSISPTSREFGGVTRGQTSGTFTFTVTNTGQSPTTALSVTKTGTTEVQNQFPITNNTCTGVTLAPNGTCTMLVSFSPPLSTSTGVKTTNLQVTAAQGGTATSVLSGTAN
jgi:hypothetical protein